MDKKKKVALAYWIIIFTLAILLNGYLGLVWAFSGTINPVYLLVCFILLIIPPIKIKMLLTKV